MVIILWDWASLGTAHITWCSGADCAYPLTATSLWYRMWRNANMPTTTLPSYVNDCKKPLRKCKSSSLLRLRDRSDTMTERLMPFCWNQVTWSWLKLMPTRGRGNWRTSGRRNHMKWYARSLWVSFVPQEEWVDKMLNSSPWNWLFLITPAEGIPLHIVIQAEWAGCTTTTLEGQTSYRCETEKVPQSVDCLLPAQWQTVETPLGCVIRKLCAILQTSSGARWIKCEEFDVGRPGMCRCQYKNSCSRGTDHTGEVCRIWAGYDKLNPTSLCSRECKLITLGCEMGVLVCASIFGVTILPSTLMLWELLASPHKGPCAIITLPDGYNPALCTNLEHIGQHKGMSIWMVGEQAWAALYHVGVLNHLSHLLMSETKLCINAQIL